jgi:tRNA threonylcarbamoyl adenosine modification protein (Sua5/YciO/YrdC/YwlC family)
MTPDEIARSLANGAVAIIPTDTVYGIAASLEEPGAVERIFELKGRPASKPLPVLGASLDALRTIAVFDTEAEALARKHWPGPLTLVLERAPGFDVDLGGDASATVAVRVPDRGVTLELLEITGPLAVTSANRSGEEPASTPAEALAAFGLDVPLLDDGPLAGEVSTVLSLASGRTILREGAIPASDLR